MLIAITIVQLLAALVLILIVLFQSGKSKGLSGAIGGIADSYMSKRKARPIDATLATAVITLYYNKEHPRRRASDAFLRF